MKMRLVLFTACVLTASLAFAQTPARPAAPAAPATPAPPAVVPPAPPPAPPAPPGLRRDQQPINIKVELTFSEDGNGAPVKKTVTTVAGDGFSGSVRETSSGTPGLVPVALNVDASPTILPNGKIRLTFNIQYTTGQISVPSEGRLRTDIRQNLTLILDNGRTLRVSEAADPVSDRHVTVDVTATILK